MSKSYAQLNNPCQGVKSWPSSTHFSLDFTLARWSDNLAELYGCALPIKYPPPKFPLYPSSWHQALAFPLPSLRFLEKLQFLRVHCLKSLVAKERDICLVRITSLLPDRYRTTNKPNQDKQEQTPSPQINKFQVKENHRNEL